jgi:flagellar biogenesis protein FliO
MRTSLSILLLIFVAGNYAFAQEPDIEDPLPPSKAVRSARTAAKPKPAPVKSVIKAEPKQQAKSATPMVSETKSVVPAASPEKTETKPEPQIQQPKIQQALTAEPMGENDRLDFMRTDDVEQPQEPSSGRLIIKSVGALALVIALLLAGTWSLRKLGFGGKKPSPEAENVNLTIVSSIPMGGGRTLSTIQFGDRILLVGATPQNISLLAEEIPFDNEFSRRPRSVADLLAGDDRSFEEELDFMTQRWEASEQVS